MTNDDIETILDRTVRGDLSARAAINALVAGGLAAGDAEQAVFLALGGGDLVQIGTDGLERYTFSGRLVTEVIAAMGK
jgi:hypothetical protein